MSGRRIDSSRSSLRLHTFAEGLLSRLAHDLAIEATELSGTSEDDLARGRLKVKVADLRVVGAVKRGAVDPSVLSASDCHDIEQKIRSEVLPGAAVVVEGERSGGRARVTVIAPTGRASLEVPVNVGSDGVASGRCDLSLKALGIAPVKGPLGAFRLSDRVEAVFRLAFTEG